MIFINGNTGGGGGGSATLKVDGSSNAETVTGTLTLKVESGQAALYDGRSFNDSAGYAQFDGTALTSIQGCTFTAQNTPFLLPNLATVAGLTPGGWTSALGGGGLNGVVSLNLSKGSCPPVAAITATNGYSATDGSGTWPGGGASLALTNVPTGFTWPVSALTLTGSNDEGEEGGGGGSAFLTLASTTCTGMTLPNLTLYGGSSGDGDDGFGEVQANIATLAAITFGTLTLTGGSQGATTSWIFDFSGCALTSDSLSTAINAVVAAFQMFQTANPSDTTSYGALHLDGGTNATPSDSDNIQLALLIGWTITTK